MIVDDFGKVDDLPDRQWQTISLVDISGLGELMLDDGKYCPGVSNCEFELQNRSEASRNGADRYPNTI